MGGSNLIKNLDLPKKMTLLTPANGATIYTTVPTLTWQANPEAGGTRCRSTRPPTGR
jgi:hypothetical protein